MILLITLVTFLMLVIGGVSAENVDVMDTSSLNEVSLANVNEISDTGSTDIQSYSSDDGNGLAVSDSVEDIDEDKGDISDSKNTLKESGSEDSRSIDVKVNYEYSADANKISPDFYIVSADGKYLNFTKKFDFNSKKWTLNLEGTLEGDCNITTMSAGYITQSKIVSGASLSDLVLFDLKATEAYKLGRAVSTSADKILDFASADDILVVTTAGVAKLNGKTSEDGMEAILNYDNSIAYTNVLMLRQSAVDPIDFAFIIKKGNQLKAVVFQNASTSPVYKGTISENMTKKEWNTYYNAVFGENAWAFASLANGWAAGISREILQEAAFHGHICEGTLGGYSIIQALLKYYPPEQETNPGGIGSPADITAYKVLGVPGGSDDDAALFFLDDTIGKTGYVGMNTTNTGATENMLGFIKWNSQTKSGDLIIMTFNSSDVKKLFTKETGINPDAGSLEELKYNSWWIKQINTNPEKLVNFLYEFTGLNQEQYNYLMGTTDNVTYDGEPFDYGMDGHGLDLNYILSLNLPQATRANVDNNLGHLSDAQLKQIGIDAADQAKLIFMEELGVDIDRDDVDFLALTDASYAFLNGQETVVVLDGLNEALGATLYSQTLLNLHQAVWKPLWFAFALRYPDSNLVNMVYLRYNSATNDFFVGELEGNRVVDIGFNTLNDSAKLKKITQTFVPDGNWFNIQSIINAWNEHPLFDQMSTFLYHAHVCPGVQPGFFITDYIQNEYPLGENESYTYIASSIYCKDDSLTYLLDLSPGLGNYYVQKLPKNETASEYIDDGTQEGIIIVWDDNLKVGRAAIVSFKWATIDTSMYGTSEGKRAAQIKAYIDMYANNENPNIKALPVVSTDCEKWITEEQFKMLKQGAGDDFNVITYLKSLDNLTKEDLLKAMENNTNSNSNANSNSNSNSNSNDNAHTNSNSNSNSNSNDNANTNSNSNSNSNINTNTNPESNSAISNQSHKSLSSSIGTSGDIASSAPSVDTAYEDGDTNPSDASSYEVSKSPVTKSADFNALAYALIGVLAIGILLGLGYVRHK
ncbi:Protein containing a metal-binding domain shared with formylmethanofuran dehydrogenase subunit E [Methanobrevibacter olleyae]|uniref:Protein containing a metal-binding domain shared with formylmethanofuran dehydrogenase subunit E n=1 Tax=Methanobrevibacter olleyae TaxID=294671 RepID=A0A1I4J3C1_METOL|nr:FmdE family protein [Methanobrevibacter olleyae]SFL60641.1 Protein containing a metal-binding domain shared with formylmethanofuran dehydrogenase subunit E [Methanobrevibacter olleyae]